jgi:hypothetical protein
MSDDVVSEVRAIQASMVDEARSTFSESELESLRVVVRLAVEFRRFLRQPNSGLVQHSPAYVCGSVFSGVDAFCDVAAAYRVLVGSTNSRIDWPTMSRLSFAEEFESMFGKFEREDTFEEKCRLLLDLFKLQIVFAGIVYE